MPSEQAQKQTKKYQHLGANPRRYELGYIKEKKRDGNNILDIAGLNLKWFRGKKVTVNRSAHIHK